MEQKILFEIQTLEWIAANRPEQLDQFQRSGLFEIIWIKKGSGTCIIDLEKYEIRDNAIFCVDAGQLRLLQATGEIQGYYISFSTQFLYLSENNNWPLFDAKSGTQGGRTRIIQADDELQIELEVIAGKMIKEFTSYYLLRSEILKGLLKILMIYLTRRLDPKKPEMTVNRNCEILRKFMLLLENNITKKKMVCDYASDLGITPSHLNEIVKKTTGFPANHHIQQRKILEAKRQAMYYGVSMKEIAYYLGFDDLSHFSKFFKTNSGSSFQNFKKEIQGNSVLPHPPDFSFSALSSSSSRRM